MSTETDIDNPDAVNRDPEDVKRANGRLLFGGAMVGMVLFVCALAFVALFGVPSSGPGGGEQQQAATTTQSGTQ